MKVSVNKANFAQAFLNFVGDANIVFGAHSLVQIACEQALGGMEGERKERLLIQKKLKINEKLD